MSPEPVISPETAIPPEPVISGSNFSDSGIHRARFPPTPLAFPQLFLRYSDLDLPRKGGYSRTRSDSHSFYGMSHPSQITVMYPRRTLPDFEDFPTGFPSCQIRHSRNGPLLLRIHQFAPLLLTSGLPLIYMLIFHRNYSEYISRFTSNTYKYQSQINSD